MMSEKSSKKEAKIKSFMLVQDCNPEHFNTEHGPVVQPINGQNIEMFYWSDVSKERIAKADIARVTDMVRFLLCSSVRDTATDYNDDVVSNIYGIVHDEDTREVWSAAVGDYVIEKKFIHFHIVVELGIPLTLKEISYKLNVAPQYIEKPKTGPYGLDNFLSYLVHAKDFDKFQYNPDDVFSHPKNKKTYSDIYAERRADWIKGAAKKTRKRAIADCDELEQAILSGSITKENILFDDYYYQIYAANKNRIDNAFLVYMERKMYLAVKAMERGEFKTAIFFITGRSGSGKSYFTDSLIRGIIETVKDREGDDWAYYDCAATNSVDDYLGEEIVKMDDLRGASMKAEDWLKLLDPDRSSSSSARYHNRKMAPRCIIINSHQDPLHFFYYARGIGGGDRSEPLDQFLRRIAAKVQVYTVPDQNDPHNPALFDRKHNIGVCKLGDGQTVVLSKEKDYWGNYKDTAHVRYQYDTNYMGRDLNAMTADEALEFLINTVWFWSYGSKYPKTYIDTVIDDDNYIHNDSIKYKTEYLTPEEAAEEQAYHDSLYNDSELDEIQKEETISEIIDHLEQNLYYTDSDGQQCTNQPIIDGLKNGTLTIERYNGKIRIVPNTDSNKKDGDSDDN